MPDLSCEVHYATLRKTIFQFLVEILDKPLTGCHSEAELISLSQERLNTLNTLDRDIDAVLSQLALEGCPQELPRSVRSLWDFLVQKMDEDLAQVEI